MKDHMKDHINLMESIVVPEKLIKKKLLSNDSSSYMNASNSFSIPDEFPLKPTKKNQP